MFILFPPVLFKELGEKEWVVQVKAKFSFCVCVGDGREYISHQQICLLCSAPEKGTWLDLTYGINIINS